MPKQTSRCPACKRLPEQGCIDSCTKKAAESYGGYGTRPHIKLGWEEGTGKPILIACQGMTRKDAETLAWEWLQSEAQRTPIAERKIP